MKTFREFIIESADYDVDSFQKYLDKDKDIWISYDESLTKIPNFTNVPSYV